MIQENLLKLVLDFVNNLWITTLIIATTITICQCFKIHSNNKLKGGGYVAQYLAATKDDPELKKRVFEWIEKSEKAIEGK